MMSFGLILCKEPVTSVKLSNDTNCVLLSCLDSHLRLLDKSNGDILNDYSGHKNEVYALRSCFSYDDAYVISGSENNQILFWDLVEVCARLWIVLREVMQTLSCSTLGLLTPFLHRPESLSNRSPPRKSVNLFNERQMIYMIVQKTIQHPTSITVDTHLSVFAIDC